MGIEMKAVNESGRTVIVLSTIVAPRHGIDEGDVSIGEAEYHFDSSKAAEDFFWEFCSAPQGQDMFMVEKCPRCEGRGSHEYVDNLCLTSEERWGITVYCDDECPECNGSGEVLNYIAKTGETGGLVRHIGPHNDLRQQQGGQHGR